MFPGSPGNSLIKKPWALAANSHRRLGPNPRMRQVNVLLSQGSAIVLQFAPRSHTPFHRKVPSFLSCTAAPERTIAFIGLMN